MRSARKASTSASTADPCGAPSEGHVGGVITFRDVTTRKQAETKLAEAMQDLRDQSELMEAAFNGISEGLVVVNTRRARCSTSTPWAERSSAST